MKTNKYLGFFILIFIAVISVQCISEDDNAIIQETCRDGIQNGDETGIDCGGSLCAPCDDTLNFTGTFRQEDQMGRPLTNTLYGKDGFRDQFNFTLPSDMQGAFQGIFKESLLIMNPDFTTNILGLDATQLSILMSRDVLWLAQNGITTYNNGSKILTGRGLEDDVIDHSLMFVYGGPDGTENPNLTDDGVPSNDIPFLSSFPYLAEPFE